jgi:hypothetical protein
MRNAIWFSRHQTTAEQIADAESIGFSISGVARGMELGAISLTSVQDVEYVNNELHNLCHDCRAIAIFGVIPVPLRAYWLAHRKSCPARVWEAWNVQRTVEGGKPTFAHKGWERTR